MICVKCKIGNYVEARPFESKYKYQCDNINCGSIVDSWDLPALEKQKETILEEAARLVNGPRRAEYGHPKDNFEDVAKMWQILLRDKLVGPGITPDDVILMMLCLKICRGKTGYKRDTATDIAGYAQCWELVNE
jgi:hypothetical protein